VNRKILSVLLAMSFVLGGILIVWWQSPTKMDCPFPAPEDLVLTSYPDLTGSLFTASPPDPQAPPRLSSIPIPEFPGASAIWGSTGRDTRGHVWIGVSASDVPVPSAHLFEYNPDTKEMIDRGDVVSELKRAGIYRVGEGQMKIHSKILQGVDGHLYFASMDEQGEKDDGSRLPTWGSHLWRVRLPECRWEHLFEAPEGLIAVSSAGRYLYALGYFDHVLYQYDHDRKRHRRIRVGSLGGHISRNFFSDERGHVWVPRVSSSPKKGEPPLVHLVELSSDLEELGRTPLAHYLSNGSLDSHGIVGFVYLKDRSMVFVTDVGFLYRVRPSANGPARVEEIGWFHPKGASYTPSLFTYEGERYLLGVAQRQPDGAPNYHWLIYDLETGRSTATPLQLPPGEGAPWPGLLLYGSVTRDGRGSFYLGGAWAAKGRWNPLLFQAGKQDR
jgi:hypothetical protein